ncbi:TlpA family protein disulfide reductase [Propionicicella superfundia]|uniref:TlpA family protein disulfide reductase n=1 Tax=Propionicicella superfundia TaxID=348582 RepID=UPI00041096F1|nr:TlpA disulfide reductase family protein [Propionicicella superfundia]
MTPPPVTRLRRAVAAVAAAVLLAGCGSTPTAEGGYVSGDGSLTRIAVSQRQAAPILTGIDLDGKPLDSSAFTGKVIVYNVWGSWCAPCRKEAPALAAAAERTAGTAQFLGINTRDLDRGPAQAFVRAQGIGFPSFYDPQGELLLNFGSQVSPSAIPTTIVVDAEGRLAARVLGEVTETTIVGLVTEIAEGA